LRTLARLDPGCVASFRRRVGEVVGP
jgi:hypothetical protein